MTNRRTLAEWEAMKPTREAEGLAKRQAEAHDARALADLVEQLEPHDLRMFHIRDNGVLANKMPFSSTWKGGSCSVLSIRWPNGPGRLYAVARVNKKAGDHFSKKQAWKVLVPRLAAEFDRLRQESNNFETTRRDLEKRGVWGHFFAYTRADFTFETYVYLNLSAASRVIVIQVLSAPFEGKPA